MLELSKELAQKLGDAGVIDVDSTVKAVAVLLDEVLSQDIFVAVQQGGSSAEWYAVAFTTEADAMAGIKEWNDHTYDSVGPFSVPRCDEGEWLHVINDALGAAVNSDYANKDMEPDYSWSDDENNEEAHEGTK